MKLNIAVLTGDGISPEVTEQAIEVFKAIAIEYYHSILFTSAPVGAIAIDATGNPLPDSTLELCKTSDAVLFGTIGDPKYDHASNAQVRPETWLMKLRKTFGLYANIRTVKAHYILFANSP
ncbi:isocitrate/isopropylmalate family dehydrogenase, partial [Mangrovimonas sp. ST2L15]|uniref:isocitrate/isopropylmalate family dehydrogenase n=1 Tax=Mangrovimonas sp. ST2L15 TaxID=1645916 RepID=UPI002100F99E